MSASDLRTGYLRPFDGELTAEPWLWAAALTGRSEHLPRTIRVGVELRSYGVHPRAYARGVLWYGVKRNFHGWRILIGGLRRFKY